MSTAPNTAPTATLYRAVAYRLQRFDTPEHLQQPEVHVFVEAADTTAASALLLRSLALLWHCEPADIEFYNLFSQDELLGDKSLAPREMGDAGLLVTGWYHGPLFARPDRTLALVSPRTQARLHRAGQLALPWARRQREAALLAAGASRGQAVARSQLIADLATAADAAEAAEAGRPTPLGPSTAAWVANRSAGLWAER